jgi:hypothetical protein
VPLAPDPELARAALSQLDALRATVVAVEDDVLACLVVTGEPRPQRVLDDWLDQVADTLRALGETAADLSPALARYAVAPVSAQPAPGGTGTAEPGRAGSPAGAPGRAGSPAAARGHDHDGHHDGSRS